MATKKGASPISIYGDHEQKKTNRRRQTIRSWPTNNHSYPHGFYRPMISTQVKHQTNSEPSDPSRWKTTWHLEEPKSLTSNEHQPVVARIMTSNEPKLICCATFNTQNTTSEKNSKTHMMKPILEPTWNTCWSRTIQPQNTAKHEIKLGYEETTTLPYKNHPLGCKTIEVWRRCDSERMHHHCYRYIFTEGLERECVI